MSAPFDGFYAAYLSGKYGQGFALLIFQDGVIVGADASGVVFDGKYSQSGDDTLSVTLLVKSPPNLPLIQGGTTGPQGEQTHLDFEMPRNFASQNFIRVDGPRGATNAKFVRLRGLSE